MIGADNMPHPSENAVPPFTLVVAAGEKVISAKIATRGQLMQILTKFAGRLEGSARGRLLMALAELPEALPSFWCCAGEDWRVSFSGALGQH